MSPLPLSDTSATRCHLCHSVSPLPLTVGQRPLLCWKFCSLRPRCLQAQSRAGRQLQVSGRSAAPSLGPVGSSKSRAGRQLGLRVRPEAPWRQCQPGACVVPRGGSNIAPSKRAHRQSANTKNGLGSRGLRQRLCYRLSPRHSSSSSRIEASFPPSLPPSCPPSLPPSLSPSLSPLSTRVCVSLSHSHTLLLLHHHQYRHHHHHHHHHHHNNNNNNNNKNNNNLFLVF